MSEENKMCTVEITPFGSKYKQYIRTVLRPKEKIVEVFDVVSETGHPYTITIMADLIYIGLQCITGHFSALTEGGYHCNRIDDDNWCIVELDLHVSRVKE